MHHHILKRHFLIVIGRKQWMSNYKHYTKRLHGTLLLFLRTRVFLVVNGFTKSKHIRTGLLNVINTVFMKRTSPKNMVFTMKKSLIQLLALPQFTLFFMLLLLVDGHYFKWMSKMHFSMEILLKKYMWSLLMVMIILHLKRANFFVHYMVSNKLPKSGFLSLAPLLPPLASVPAHINLVSLFERQVLYHSYFIIYGWYGHQWRWYCRNLSA